MKNEILKLVALFTYYFKTLRLRSKEFFLIKIKRTHLRYEIIKLQDDLKTSQRVAIVAVYPRKALLKSVKILIEALEDQGYSALIVINETKKSEQFIEQLHSNCSIIVRPNIGRDFGAYQSGVFFLGKLRRIELVKSLVLANDSVFYHKKSFNFIKDSLNSKSAWSTFFVNFQFRMHAQSFFLQFGAEILNSPEFMKFWRRYYPTSVRHRVINSGEIKLSKMLLKVPFLPHYSVSPKSFSNYTSKLKLSVEERVAIWSPSQIPPYELGNLNRSDDLTQISFIFDRHNPTHHLGLLSARVLGSPIKLDLVSTGLTTISGLYTTLVDLEVDENEIDDLMELIMQKGTVASVQGIQRLWQKFGLLV